MAKAYTAGGTIRRARFVKLSTTEDHTVLECDANDRVFGISQVGGREAPIPAVTADPPEAAQDGDQLMVHVEDSEDALLEAGTGGWTAGDLLESDADGKGVAVSEGAGTSEEVGARALETVSAGELGKVEVYRRTLTTPA